MIWTAPKRMKNQLMLAVASMLLAQAPGLAAAQASLQEAAPAMTLSQQAMQAASRGDVDGALQILTEAATAGDFEAQFTLAAQYSGASAALLVAPDYPTARSWMQKAAAQKDNAVGVRLDEHALSIGAAIRDGAFPRADAVILYDDRQAADQRRKNPEEALRWLEIAAQFGNVNIIRQIGNVYAEGVGVEQNFAVAAQYYSKIADQDPKAEIWLGNYNIQQRKLREAMYWLDRYYLDETEKQSHETDFDKVMHRFYGALLPESPAGATSVGINHRMDADPVKAAHLGSDDVLYSVVFLRQYRHPATGKEFVIRVHLNNFELAHKITTKWGTALRGKSDLHLKINRHDAISGIDTESGGELIVIAPLKTHIVINAQMMDSKGDDPDDVEILKEALRVTDIDGLVAAADGHGYYKKDGYGAIYKQ